MYTFIRKALRCFISGKFFFLGLAAGFMACDYHDDESIVKTAREVYVSRLTETEINIRDYVPEDAVTAWMGSTFWTPKGTEAAYRWARNMGSDYLQLDVQQTREVRDENGQLIEPSVLVVYSKEDLSLSSNIEYVFPSRAQEPLSSFSWSELNRLDLGTPFNYASPQRSRTGFEGLGISTLEDVVMIAEGFRIVRTANKDRKQSIVLRNGELQWDFFYEQDPADNGNRPGLFIHPAAADTSLLKKISLELERLGWNIDRDPKDIPTQPGKVQVANTKGRVFLHASGRKMLAPLEFYFGGFPKSFSENTPLENSRDAPFAFADQLNFAVNNYAQFIFWDISLGLLEPWQADLVHRTGMRLHVGRVNHEETFKQVTGYYFRERLSQMFPASWELADGVLTDLPDLSLLLYASLYNQPTRRPSVDAVEILDELGY
ncbi:MAG: hypothetical protein MI784_00160 [Cytophagales bacterium]|nr:hypothetical protein [Cytophagales bacterium]